MTQKELRKEKPKMPVAVEQRMLEGRLRKVVEKKKKKIRRFQKDYEEGVKKAFLPKQPVVRKVKRPVKRWGW